MPKRKLSDLETTPQPNPNPKSKSKSSIQATRLTQLFDQGVHNLSRALKTARGFERQKLGKREQRAKKEKDEKLLGRIGEEIGALKVCLFFFSFRSGFSYCLVLCCIIYHQGIQANGIVNDRA